MTQYICLEGTEGSFKTTNTDALVLHLRSKGFKVLQTKEPGTTHLPITLELRKLMIDNQYEPQMTKKARELISQAIRSIHMEKLVKLADKNGYDYVIQDRGILSGLAYGEACGNNFNFLFNASKDIVEDSGMKTRLESLVSIYDHVIYLKGNAKKGLDIALACKQEFETGDAIEAKGSLFIENVQTNMDKYSALFNTNVINIDQKTRTQIFDEILLIL